MQISSQFFDQFTEGTSGNSSDSDFSISPDTSHGYGDTSASGLSSALPDCGTHSGGSDCAIRTPNFRVSSVLSASDISKLFQLVYFEPYPVSVAARYLQIDNKKLLDFLVTKHGKTFFITSHAGSEEDKGRELWVRANTLNLIQRKAIFKPIAVERTHCIKRVLHTNGFCEFNKKTKKPNWLNKIYQYNQIDFMNYKKRISHKALLFLKDPTKPDNFFAPALTLPYSTRFTDKIKQKATRAKYFTIMENNALIHNKALMVTITEDPKLHNNLWETNKSHSQGMNTLISFLKKRIKAEINRYPYFKTLHEAVKRGIELNYNSLSGLKNKYIKKLHEQFRRDHPETTYQDFKQSLINGSFTSSQLADIILKGYTISSHFKDINPDTYEFKYLNIGEFQLNGRLHSHFLIFGLDYIIDVHELSKKLPEYGLGNITHIYALKKNPNNPKAWTWKNPKNTPKDSRNKDPVDYLKVYLLKSQYLTAVNYWVFNSRYYTNSRNYEPIEKRTERAILRKQKRLAPKIWTYVKTVDAHTDQFSNIRYVGIDEYIKCANAVLNSVGGEVA